MMGIENLPQPSPEVKKMILEDVNRHHRDSSDDEEQEDQDFQAQSRRLTQLLVDGLEEDQVEDIEENMKNYKYERAVATNQVNDELLSKLGMKRNDGSSPAPVFKKVKKSGFLRVESKRLFEFNQKDYTSRSVLTKMIKTKDRPSKKTFKLKAENIHDN